MYKIIALMGESGCGKDYIATSLTTLYPNAYHRVVADTTRPKRDYEVDGVDYNFISIEDFAGYVLDGTMLEASCFNDNWYYGTNKLSLNENKINIVILNPIGFERLKENNDEDIKIYSIYIKTEPLDRLVACLHRESNPDCHEICRRFLADEEMFKDFKPDLTLTNFYSSSPINRKLELDKIFKFEW